MAGVFASHLSAFNEVNEEYFLKHGIFDIMNDLTKALAKAKPANHLHFMQQWLTNVAQKCQGGSKSDDLTADRSTVATTTTTTRDYRIDNASDLLSDDTREVDIIDHKSLELAEFLPSKKVDEGSGPIGWRSAYDSSTKQGNLSVSTERSSGRTRQLHIHVDPDIHAYTKQLVDIVHRLSPSDHMAALVFLESLLEKKHTPVNLGLHTMADSVAGVTVFSGESNVTTQGTLHRQTSFGLHGVDTYSGVASSICCGGAPLDDLLEDTLTVSVNTRDPTESESKDTLPTANVSETPFCVSQQSGVGPTSSYLLGNTSIKNCDVEQSPQLCADVSLKRFTKGHHFCFKAPHSMSVFDGEKKEKRSITNNPPVTEELNLLREKFLTCEHFSVLDETLIEIIIRKMERYTLSSGELRVFKNGFFFLYSGTVVVEHDNNVVQTVQPKDLWKGKMPVMNTKEKNLENEIEEIILYNIRAVDDVVLLFMEYQTYQYLLENEKYERQSLFFEFFSGAELMAVLSNVERRHLADALRVRNVKADTVIVQKGQSIEWFSFIMNGTAVRTLDDKCGEFVEKLKKNESKNCGHDYFPLTVTTGHFIGGFEIFFKLNALTNIVAVTNMTVAQLHLVYFRSYLSRQTLEKMKHVLTSLPIAQLIAKLSSDEVRQSAEHARKRVTDTSAKSLWTKIRSNCISKMNLSRCGSRMYDAFGKMLAHAKNSKTRCEGEIVYAGKNNLYRFPLIALETINTIIIAVLTDSTIVRWNPTAERVTGFHRQGVSGRRLFDLLATETSRRCMREQLSHGRKHAGNWNEYVAAGLSSPRVYRFRQASALYHVTVVLSVVPACPETSSDVLLILGREADNHAAANYIEDATRWMSNVLQPQLRAFQKQAESLEKRNWNMSLEEGKRLVGHVQACNKLMERYLRLASLNLESMSATWKPVRLHNLLRQFLRDLLPQVRNDGNYLTINFEDNVPSCEVFFDVEHVLEVLTRVVSSASKGRSNIFTKIVVSVAEPSPSSCVGRRNSFFSTCSQGIGITSFSNAASESLRSPSPVSNSGPSSWNSAPTRNEGVQLCKPLQVRQVIDGSVSSMRRICIAVIDNAKCLRHAEGEQGTENYLTSVTLPSVNEEEKGLSGLSKTFTDIKRSEAIKDCEKLVAGMGGNLFFKVLQDEPEVNVVTIELPLLPVPWGDDSDKECDNVEPFVNRSFTVIIAERDSKQQSILCQLMWARRHAVIPVTSFRELIDKLGKNGVDILVIDPLYLEATEEEYENLKNGTVLFNTLQQLTHFVVVLYANDFNDWRARKLIEFCRVIELPKPAPASLLHLAMHEAERFVTSMREYEDQIALLRMAFTEFQPDRYKVIKSLGKGTFGEVFEVEDLITGGTMAMKQMFLDNGVIADDIVQELVAMTTLKHENIIHYLYCQKESDTQLSLFMELASGGTLRSKIRKHKGPLPLEDIKRHLHDLCRGLAYLHSQNYVHCDIKTANALIDHQGRTKIGDFGTAKRLKQPTDKLYNIVGSPQFMAPEVMNADSSQRLGFNQKADIWSIGCVALELATGLPPFSYLECTGGLGIYMYIAQLTDTPDLSPLINNCDILLYMFIKNCLCVNPDERPTAQELLHHDFMQGVDTNSRNKRLVRQIEMAQKLQMYAAIDQDGYEEDFDDNDEEEEEDDNDFIFDDDDNDDDVIVESRCEDDFDYDFCPSHNNYGHAKNTGCVLCDNCECNKCLNDESNNLIASKCEHTENRQQVTNANEEDFFATSSSSSLL